MTWCADTWPFETLEHRVQCLDRIAHIATILDFIHVAASHPFEELTAAPLIAASWNQIIDWLCQIDQLQQAAVAQPKAA